MCGIFSCLNFLAPKTRGEVIDILIQGLQRMQYRGYDSAGTAIDGSNDNLKPHGEIVLMRKAERSLIETLKPLDPSREKEIDRKQTRELLTYLRRTPFEQLAEDIGRQNEEEDSSKMLARILNKKRERMQLRGELKEDHPAADEDDDESVPERRKTFFDIVYPDFVY